MQNVARSESTFTPTIQIQETFISNETSTLDESGEITTVSPGILYVATGSKANISLNYLLNARYYDDLSQDDDVDHSLIFNSLFTHVPNHWDSYLNSTIEQANFDPDATQIVNSEIQSENSRQLRTIGVGTSLRGKWNDDINYESQFDADYADFENSDGTGSLGILLGINDNNSQKNINWYATFSSRDSNAKSVDRTLDTFIADLNYRINLRYSMFFNVEKTSTDNDFLDETSSIVGLRWTPNKDNSIKLGVGRRGDNTSYFLDGLIKSQRIIYTFNYDESVTTSRALLIDNTNQQGLVPTSQTLSIDPLIAKNARIAIKATGKRTDITLTYIKQKLIRDDTGDEDETTNGVSLNIDRKLSAPSSIELNISRQERESSEENVIDDLRLSYIRNLTKKVKFSVDLRKTEQTSDLVENEYDQRLLTFRISSTF